MARIRRSDIPEFYCPIEVRLNEHTDKAEKNSWEWVRKFGLVPEGGVEYRALQAEKAAWLVGYTNPDAAADDLYLISDFMTWICIYDDLSDAANLGKHPDKLSILHQRLVDVLNGADVSGQDDNLTQALQDICQRLIQRTSCEWVERFARDVEQQLQGFVWESTNRLAGITPDLSSYVKLRPYSLTIFPNLDLTWVSQDIPANAKFLRHIYVQQMTVMVCNHIGWTNDVLGINRELREENPHNIVLVLQQEYNLSLQDAVKRAVEMCNAEVKAFLNLESRLPSFGETEDISLKRYIDGLRSWIRGHLNWCSETARYPF
ncbi:hypothetical protein [Microseira sp. BLCC-F43]|jgi:5-epi-alpha-selinene synthase|uniref:terpene synthase family protein n=1 Tax=Microseira sp. BLCC-F43 TaxID=3153602 RepID=UPI0035B7FDC3